MSDRGDSAAVACLLAACALVGFAGGLILGYALWGAR